ncbi:hypothetical protein D3C81_907370 [compost metagenome]
MHLQREIGDLERRFGGVELGNGALRARAAALHGPRRAVSQCARCLRAYRHVDDVLLHQLERSDRAPELFALQGVVCRQVQRALRRAHRAHRHIEAAEVKADQHLAQAFSFLAQQVGGGYLRVLEGEGRGAGAAGEHHVDRRGGVRRGVAFDQEERQLAVAGVAVSARHHDAEVGEHAVGDPQLAAVEHVAVAALVGAGLDLGHVGADVRLRDRHEGLALIAQQRAHETFLLRFGAVGVDDARDDVQPVEQDAQRQPAVAGFFHHHGPGQVVQAQAAVGLRQVAAEVAEIGQARQRLVRKALFLLRLVDARGDVFLQVAADVVAQQLLAGIQAIDVDIGINHSGLRSRTGWCR